MTQQNATTKPGRKVRTLDEEIQRATYKLQQLQERKKQQEKRQRERNQKAVLELIKAERLDTVPAEQWEKALPQIKTLLVVNSAKPTEPVQPL